MMRYAIVIDGRAVNVAHGLPPLPDGAQAVQSETANVGDLYANGVFSPPEPVPQPRRITRLAMRQRFTGAERTALEIAKIDDPAAPMPQRQAAAALRVALDDLMVATYVDLDRADTRASVQGLESAGLIGTGRALAILDAPVQPHERFEG